MHVKFRDICRSHLNVETIKNHTLLFLTSVVHIIVFVTLVYDKQKYKGSQFFS